MLALCRLCGLPARYVSGHLLGEGGTHAWVEVLVPHPRTRVAARRRRSTRRTTRAPGLRYITVAVGRDYGDVAPTSGTFEGPFGGELTTHKRAAVTRVEYLRPRRRRRRRARPARLRRSGLRPSCSRRSRLPSWRRSWLALAGRRAPPGDSRRAHTGALLLLAAAGRASATAWGGRCRRARATCRTRTRCSSPRGSR